MSCPNSTYQVHARVAGCPQQDWSTQTENNVAEIPIPIELTRFVTQSSNRRPRKKSSEISCGEGPDGGGSLNTDVAVGIDWHLTHRSLCITLPVARVPASPRTLTLAGLALGWMFSTSLLPSLGSFQALRAGKTSRRRPTWNKMPFWVVAESYYG